MLTEVKHQVDAAFVSIELSSLQEEKQKKQKQIENIKQDAISCKTTFLLLGLHIFCYLHKVNVDRFKSNLKINSPSHCIWVSICLHIGFIYQL